MSCCRARLSLWCFRTLRHFVTIPEPLFLKKCNITVEDCISKSTLDNIPLADDGHLSMCAVNSSVTSVNNLFDSLHHFPDKTCCLIGASLVTFLATLYFWNRINKKGKSLYEAHSFQQCLLVLVQVSCVTLVFVYIFFLYQTFEDVQIYGLFIGGLIQLMIVCSTLPKNDADNAFLPTAVVV